MRRALGADSVAPRSGSLHFPPVDTADRVAELAQVNIARLREPLDSERLADFVASLDDVNAEADSAPGFLWRLQDDEGNATGITPFAWDQSGSAGVIVNLSTWTGPDALRAYVFSGRHAAAVRRRREWFHRVAEATTALWWVPAGHRPNAAEAEDRLRTLRRDGPTPTAFTVAQPFPAQVVPLTP